MKKNFKNLFRNWTSMFLIVIGPLILMAIIFLAFSDVGFNNIRIGYVVDDEAGFAEFKDKISYLDLIKKYGRIHNTKKDDYSLNKGNDYILLIYCITNWSF